MAFERWSTQLNGAGDDSARRQLLGEIGVWRARHLTDVPALREAAYAISTLHDQLGDKDAAVREARSLLSLCQTTPEAQGSEIAKARQLLSTLGASAPKVKLASKARQPRDDRGGRGERKSESRRDDRREKRREAPRDDRRAGPDAKIDEAVAIAAGGDFDRAMKILKGKRGRADLAAAWVRLASALAAPEPARSEQLHRLDRWLRQILKAPRAKAADVVAPPDDSALSRLLGRGLPTRRGALVRIAEAWLNDNPERADELAATALEHHVETAGPAEPAPWLAVLVARARMGIASATDAVVERLSKEGAAVVHIYDEPLFSRAVQFANAVPERFSGLRRGVIPRNGMPEDRRLWTLRIDNGDRMLVFAPAHDEPFPAEIAGDVANRLPRLCPQVVLFAPGKGNGPLREAVANAGMIALDGDPSDAELIAALDRVTAVEAPDRKPRKAAARSKASEPTRPAEAAAHRTEPTQPDPVEGVLSLLAAPEVPTVEVLEPALAGVKKMRDAFLGLGKSWETLPEDASSRLSSLLNAADKVAPDGLRVPEAVTLALRVAATLKGETLDSLAEGSVAERFGGPGIGDVVSAVSAAQDAGWSLRRAFRGTTRRERRNNAALEALDGSLDGVWRLGLVKDDEKVDVWYIAELPAEGRAALPQLLLDSGRRVVLLPIDAELMSWYGSLDTPAAIGWTGEDAGVLADALNA